MIPEYNWEIAWKIVDKRIRNYLENTESPAENYHGFIKVKPTLKMYYEKNYDLT